LTKIGVISDTHIPQASKKLPLILLKELNEVDLILHAGDLTRLEVLDMLEGTAKVEAVHGNMDEWEVIHNLPKKKILEVEDVKIGLIHGSGHPDGLLEFIKGEFNLGLNLNNEIDCIVFGHSHKTFNKVVEGVLFFNPGSPTDKIFASFQSFGILEVNKNKISGKIIKI
jgi:hypothetical protein